MPSYLEKEQILALPPFISNASAILNTFGTKLAYWGQGAARVKTAYDKYLGMDLTREDNQMRLKEFMNSAKDQMKRSIQTDLSVGDNQAEALSIFDPLVNGQSEFSKEILGDNAVTSHYQGQLATAESYRNRDGGKEYSDVNVRYLTQHLEDFSKEKDPASFRNYYSNRRFYSPYYDYNKEIREVMEAYKPSKKTVTSNGMYLQTDASTTSAEALKYINANLSDRSRRQMGIEASVNFHGRDNDLIQSVKADWDSDITKYEGYAKLLDAKSRLATDPVEKANYEAERTTVLKRVGNLKSYVTSYNRGDYSEITRNRDSYANKIYSSNLLESIAAGYARIDETLAPDTAALQVMTENGRNARFALQLEYDKERDNLDRAASLQIAQMRADKDAKDTPGSSTFAIPKAGDYMGSINLDDQAKSSNEMTVASLDKELNATNSEQQVLFSQVHDKLSNAGAIVKSDDPEMREKVVTEYLNKVSDYYNQISKTYKDPDVLKASMETKFFPGVMSVYDSFLRTNQQLYAINKVKDEIVTRGLNDVRGLYSKGELDIRYETKEPGKNNHLVIDPKSAIDFVVKGDRSVIEERQVPVKGYVIPSGDPERLGSSDTVVEDSYETRYYYKGRELSAKDMANMTSKVRSTIDRKFSSDQVIATSIWKFGPNSKVRQETADNEIKANISNDGKELKTADYQMLGYGEDGTIYFKSSEDIEGYTYKGPKDSDGRRFYGLKSNNFAIDIDSNIPANGRGVKYYVDKFVPFIPAGKSQSTPNDPNFFKIGNKSYRVEFGKNPDETMYYILYDVNSGLSIGGVKDDLYSVIALANANSAINK